MSFNHSSTSSNNLGCKEIPTSSINKIKFQCLAINCKVSSQQFDPSIQINPFSAKINLISFFT